MTKHAYGLSIAFLVFGGMVYSRPKSSVSYTEKDMEKLYPVAVDNFRFEPGSSNPQQSYTMDENTYRALTPYGIVCRVFSDGKRRFEAVVIGGDQPDTFHNPLVCFKSQDYTVTRSEQIVIKTKSRGDVPCILAEAQKNGSDQIALYTYEGPGGMHPENGVLQKDLFWTQLKTSKPQSASFFRFLTLDPTPNEQELKAFAVKFLDASPIQPKVH